MLNLSKVATYGPAGIFEYLAQIWKELDTWGRRVLDLQTVTLDQLTADVDDYDIGLRSVIRVSSNGPVDVFTFHQAFNTSTQDTAPEDLFFGKNGSKLYTVGNAGNDINEYDLVTAWDIASASFVQVFDVSGKDTVPVGIFFKPDGLKMYVIGVSSVSIHEYDLSIAWNISSALFLQTLSVSSEDTNPQGVVFKFDGLKMYVVGNTGNDITEYDLSTAWDISSAVALQTFSVNTELTTPTGMSFSFDGAIMIVAGNLGTERVIQYDLAIAWDISSAVVAATLIVETEDDGVKGVFFKPDSASLFIIGTKAPASVNEYTFAGRTITGFAGVRDSRMIIVINVDAAPIAISHEGGTSSANNRVITRSAASTTIVQRESMILVYDAISLRWRQIL